MFIYSKRHAAGTPEVQGQADHGVSDGQKREEMLKRSH